MVEKSTVLGKRERSKSPQSDQPLDDKCYTINGLFRFVKPYNHEFTTFAKRRWVGQSLLEVFSREFKAFSTNYYTEAIKNGKIRVNGKQVCPNSYKLKEGDKIIHITTREETPILAELPEILFENDALIAVNKPSSVPVHPCGNFKFNSLQYLLEFCLKLKDLKTVHRLDRQTSGIVFFAKSGASSNEFREALIGDKVSKVYYARVQGDFSSICDENKQVICKDSIYC